MVRNKEWTGLTNVMIREGVQIGSGVGRSGGVPEEINEV